MSCELPADRVSDSAKAMNTWLDDRPIAVRHEGWSEIDGRGRRTDILNHGGRPQLALFLVHEDTDEDEREEHSRRRQSAAERAETTNSMQ